MTAEVDSLVSYAQAVGAAGVVTDINTPGVHSKTSAHYVKGTCSRPQPQDAGNGCTGGAIDRAFRPAQQMTAALQSIFDKFVPVESLLWEMFYEGAPYWIKNGKRTPKSAFPAELRAAHRNHVHIAIRPGTRLPIPQVLAPRPKPTPAVFGPTRQYGDAMKRQEITTPSLDDQGNGYVDTNIAYDKFVNLVPLGPSPDRDGYGWPNWYWSLNNTNGQARIEIEGATPDKPVGFVAWFLD